MKKYFLMRSCVVLSALALGIVVASCGGSWVVKDRYIGYGSTIPTSVDSVAVSLITRNRTLGPKQFPIKRNPSDTTAEFTFTKAQLSKTFGESVIKPTDSIVIELNRTIGRIVAMKIVGLDTTVVEKVEVSPTQWATWDCPRLMALFPGSAQQPNVKFFKNAINYSMRPIRALVSKYKSTRMLQLSSEPQFGEYSCHDTIMCPVGVPDADTTTQ